MEEMKISDLPIYVLTEIFTNCTGRCIKHIRLVCRQWNELCYDLELSEKLMIRANSKVYGCDVVEDYISNCQWKILNLKFYGHHFNAPWNIDNVRRINCIALENCILKKDTFMRFVTECKNLVEFRCYYTKDIITEAITIVMNDIMPDVCNLECFRFRLQNNAYEKDAPHLRFIYSKNRVIHLINSIMVLFPNLKLLDFGHAWLNPSDLGNDLRWQITPTEFQNIEEITETEISAIDLLFTPEYQLILPYLFKVDCFPSGNSSKPFLTILRFYHRNSSKILKGVAVPRVHTVKEFCEFLSLILDRFKPTELHIEGLKFELTFELFKKIVQSNLITLSFEKSEVFFDQYKVNLLEPLTTKNSTLKRFYMKITDLHSYNENAWYTCRFFSYVLDNCMNIKEVWFSFPDDTVLDYPCTKLLESIWKIHEKLENLKITSVRSDWCLKFGNKRRANVTETKTLSHLQNLKILEMDLLEALIHFENELSALQNLRCLNLNIHSCSSVKNLLSQIMNLSLLEILVLYFCFAENIVWFELCEKLPNLRLLWIHSGKKSIGWSGFTSEESIELFNDNKSLQILKYNDVVFSRKPSLLYELISKCECQVEDLGSLIKSRSEFRYPEFILHVYKDMIDDIYQLME